MSDDRREIIDRKAVAEHRCKPSPQARLVSHRPVRLGRVAYPVCVGCGLVYLRNATTAACIQIGCWQE